MELSPGGPIRSAADRDRIVELREDVKFDTLDLLRDPVLAAKHLDLQ